MPPGFTRESEIERLSQRRNCRRHRINPSRRSIYTMAANRSGLQLSTLRNIALAWVFTLPAAAVLSGGLYWLFNSLVK